MLRNHLGSCQNRDAASDLVGPSLGLRFCISNKLPGDVHMPLVWDHPLISKAVEWKNPSVFIGMCVCVDVCVGGWRQGQGRPVIQIRRE